MLTDRPPVSGFSKTAKFRKPQLGVISPENSLFLGGKADKPSFIAFYEEAEC
jgi:hypothetical protein